ncbi:MAG: glycine cleavage system protein GcvH [Chloroflexota bacterium]|nr:glycine cleavage system protein GcvH [Chloroflexota bacterium]
MSPDDRRYTREHEWAKLDNADSRLVSVGITAFAQDELGDIVYFDLPNAGDSVSYMVKMGEVESVKAVSDLFSPVTGQIEAVNDELVDHPELVNDDPFESGWIMKVVLADLAELETLMSASEYDEYIGSN